MDDGLIFFKPSCDGFLFLFLWLKKRGNYEKTVKYAVDKPKHQQIFVNSEGEEREELFKILKENNFWIDPFTSKINFPVIINLKDKEAFSANSGHQYFLAKQADAIFIDFKKFKEDILKYSV